MKLVYISTMRPMILHKHKFLVFAIFLLNCRVSSSRIKQRDLPLNSQLTSKHFHRVSRSPMISQRSILIKTVPAIRDVTTARRRRMDNAFIFDCRISRWSQETCMFGTEGLRGNN